MSTNETNGGCSAGLGDFRQPFDQSHAASTDMAGIDHLVVRTDMHRPRTMFGLSWRTEQCDVVPFSLHLSARRRWPVRLPAAPSPLPSRKKIKVAFMISKGTNVIDMAGPWEVFQDTTVDNNDVFELFTVGPDEDL